MTEIENIFKQNTVVWSILLDHKVTDLEESRKNIIENLYQRICKASNFVIQF